VVRTDGASGWVEQGRIPADVLKEWRDRQKHVGGKRKPAEKEQEDNGDPKSQKVQQCKASDKTGGKENVDPQKGVGQEVPKASGAGKQGAAAAPSRSRKAIATDWNAVCQVLNIFAAVAPRPPMLPWS